MTTDESPAPDRNTEYVFALGDDQMLVIRANGRNNPGWYNGWYDTWRAYIGREGEPMNNLGQITVEAGRDGITEIETSVGFLYAPAPFRMGDQPMWNDEPIKSLSAKEWDVEERGDGTAIAVRLQQS